MTYVSQIAYRDNTVAKENLSYNIVLYPGFYGAFFGFKKNPASLITLCSCTKVAIENYIQFRLLEHGQNSDPTKQFILSSSEFPRLLIEDLIRKKAPDNPNVISYLTFKHQLCHECNKKTPTLIYCDEMYGGRFRQKYGWYIKKKAYELGVKMPFMEVIPDLCSQEILDVVNVPERQEIIRKLHTISGSNRLLWKQDFKLKSELDKFNRKIKNLIENEVRLAFGHKKVGEAWTSETILYYIVQSLLPTKAISRHFKPNFLHGLEFDIYINDLNIGIEYQGIQHFKAIKYWGGEEALIKLKERDIKKRQICKSLGIPLIYFYCYENLSDELVASRLNLKI